MTLRGLVSKPVAVIEGGDRSHGVADSLTLDGSSSYHPDFAPTSQSSAPLTYSWSCAAILPSGTVAACQSPGGASFGTGSPSTLTLGGGTMRSAAEVNRYVYTLTVFSTADDGAQRSSQASVTIRVLPGRALSIKIVGQAGVTYTSNSKVTFDSEVTGATTAAASYVWTTVSGDVDVTLIQNTLTPNTLPSLVIKPNVLSSSHEYRLRLTVTDAQVSGFSEIFFIVAGAPKGEECIAYVCACLLFHMIACSRVLTRLQYAYIHIYIRTHTYTQVVPSL